MSSLSVGSNHSAGNAATSKLKGLQTTRRSAELDLAGAQTDSPEVKAVGVQQKANISSALSVSAENDPNPANAESLRRGANIAGQNAKQDADDINRTMMNIGLANGSGRVSLTA